MKLGETRKEGADTSDSNLSGVSEGCFQEFDRNQDSMYRMYRNFSGASDDKGLSPVHRPVHCIPNVQDVQEPIKELKCSGPEPPPVGTSKKFDRDAEFYFSFLNEPGG